MKNFCHHFLIEFCVSILFLCSGQQESGHGKGRRIKLFSEDQGTTRNIKIYLLIVIYIRDSVIEYLISLILIMMKQK